ncbi:MAG TPA: hypothetical protein VF230_10915 [Acidimicrobiales bacterium]
MTTAVRLDGATGAIEVEGQGRVDPNEPQSSFVRWARVAGVAPSTVLGVGTMSHVLGAERWSVTITFDLGTLTTASVGIAGAEGDAGREELDAWLDEAQVRRGLFRRKPSWGRVEVARDSYGDWDVVLTYRGGATPGPPPRPDDLDALAGATLLAFGPVGDDWALPRAYVALERMRRSLPSLPELVAAFRDATAAGRIYCAHLIADVDETEGRAAFETLQDDSSPLSTSAGGNTTLITVGEYARRVVLSRSA